MKIFTSGMKMQHKMLLDVSAGESIKNKTNEEQFHKIWAKKFRPQRKFDFDNPKVLGNRIINRDNTQRNFNKISHQWILVNEHDQGLDYYL
jgi:hypothetical protein